ncbi:MAG: FAD-binding oxidoreductase [Planctomycetota bacterium]|nr:FAD-binding oxidoreductase [Planctomycetota bacterium]
MSRSTADLTERLAVRFGDMLGAPRGIAGGTPVPTVRPDDELALAELLAFGRSEGLLLLPIGAGTKIDRTPAPPGLDALIDTSAFDAMIAFEPGDGTLTAGGGASMDSLSATCREGARTIVPAVAPGATLGGVIATAESGVDRLQRGAIREHVLGLRVMLSDGRSSRSGGRLVKNVAGYDLHRLHTGAWGGLGIILEATLRLFPTWRAERRLGLELADLASGVDAARTLGEARIDARRVSVVAAGSRGPVRVVVDLAGRADVVEAEQEACLALLPGLTATPLAPPEPRPHLVLQALPSAAADLAAHGTLLRELLPADTRLDLDPLLARLACSLPDGASLPADLPEPPASLRQVLPRLPQPNLPVSAQPLARAIERSLDPHGLFARR